MRHKMQQRRRRFPALLLILVVALVGGAGFLWFKDIPAPTQPIEQKIPASQFIQ